MSAFDKNAAATTAEEEEVDSYLEKLVTEKGEKWKDPEVIAKGKVEADRFIKQLEEQNKALREDLEKSARLDEMLDLLKKSQNKASEGSEGSNNSSQDAEGRTDSSATPDEIRALIEAQMKEHETKTTYEKNVKAVDAELSRRYGDSASNVVARKAAELEMTIEEAKQLAATKPKAFFRLMGLEEDNKSTSKVLSGSAVRSEGREFGGQVRDWNYYQKLRRESKSKYHSPSVQKQMYRDMEELGERFGLPR